MLLPTANVAVPLVATPVAAGTVPPRLRPGIVVHEPTAPVDSLLAEFGLDLRRRGFSVSGFVQAGRSEAAALGQGCAAAVELFDLARNRTLTVSRPELRTLLAHALEEKADLLVVSRFSAFCGPAPGFQPSGFQSMAGAADDRTLPVLTSIAGRCVHKCHEFDGGSGGPEGAIIAPSLAALWRWWGPERLYRDLVQGVGKGGIRQIACGSRWILVEGENGCGLAYLPGHSRNLPYPLSHYARWPLSQVAQLAASWNPVEMALGIAAVNAHYNRCDLAAPTGNGMRALRSVSGRAADRRMMAGRVVAVGGFPGLGGLFPSACVIEADPRPGEFPLVAMDSLLPGCAVAVVNSSALINRNLPRILRLAQGAQLGLIGPSTPLTPRLHAYGITIAGGLLVHDPAGLAAAIRADAGPRDFGRFGRYAHISAAGMVSSPPG